MSAKAGYYLMAEWLEKMWELHGTPPPSAKEITDAFTS